MSGEEIVFRQADDLGIEVVLIQKVWLDHILKQHREMQDHLEAVKATVANPGLVCLGNRTSSEVYQRMAPVPFAPGKLKICSVIVDATDDPDLKKVTTAFISPKWYDQRKSFAESKSKILRDRRTSS